MRSFKKVSWINNKINCRNSAQSSIFQLVLLSIHQNLGNAIYKYVIQDWICQHHLSSSVHMAYHNSRGMYTYDDAGKTNRNMSRSIPAEWPLLILSATSRANGLHFCCLKSVNLMAGNNRLSCFAFVLLLTCFTSQVERKRARTWTVTFTLQYL